MGFIALLESVHDRLMCEVQVERLAEVQQYVLSGQQVDQLHALRGAEYRYALICETIRLKQKYKAPVKIVKQFY